MFNAPQVYYVANINAGSADGDECQQQVTCDQLINSLNNQANCVAHTNNCLSGESE